MAICQVSVETIFFMRNGNSARASYIIVNPSRPLLPYGYSYLVPDRVKPSFVIFDIALSVRVSVCQKLQMTA